MQINSNPIAATTEAATSPETAPAPAEAPAKPAKRGKPAAAKPVKPAKPDTAKPVSSFADERAAAATAVRAFYAGASLPFKAASASLSPINPSNAKRPSVRTAALIAAMLAYSGDNIAPDGTFKRGGFMLPAKLINPNAKPGTVLAAMPESGCIGNMLGRVVFHVSGPIGGKQARDGVFRLDFDAARRELQQLGDATAKPALAVLNRLSPVKPAKRA